MLHPDSMLPDVTLLKECHDFWFELIQKAFDKSSFDTLCTLLRPRGMHDAGWDILDEAESTFKDFNWILTTATKKRGRMSARRFALHYYCLIIEMSPIHEMILNFLRCIDGQQYLPFPFNDLNRRKKTGNPWDIIPPSMPQKLRRIKELANKLGETNLISYLDRVFDEKLRNAIAHSDYILTTGEFRTSESGWPRIIPLAELDHRIGFAFNFLSGLLKAANNTKYVLAKAKRYHQWENYEVLELLSDTDGLYGFNVHFSNGSKSTFTRTKQGVTQINMILRGGVDFMVGRIDELQPVWKVDGIPVTDWEELNKDRNAARLTRKKWIETLLPFKRHKVRNVLQKILAIFRL
jgi:hypothetical protein